MAGKIKYGMVGGGPGAFFGAVHRKAAAIDGEIDLVAGAFSSVPEKSKAQGETLNIDPNRVYSSYMEMVDKEAALPKDKRIDFVTIVTPNNTHHPIAKAFIEAGISIICDKPMTNTVEEAEDLCKLVKKQDVVFAVTYTCTGYPMVKQARELIKKGALGKIRKIIIEYSQGWLSAAIEAEGNKQAAWRTDPKQTGISSCMADLGPHVENMSSYLTGLEMEEIIADLNTFVPGRKLDDDGNILVHYNNGAHGILYASQISVGEENNLRFRIYGTDAALEWHQENPNYLFMRFPDDAEKIYKHGNKYLEKAAQVNSRLPMGHPEALIEALANIYLNATRTMAAKKENKKLGKFDLDFPTVQDGAKGVHFIYKTVESSMKKSWSSIKYNPPC